MLFLFLLLLLLLLLFLIFIISSRGEPGPPAPLTVVANLTWMDAAGMAINNPTILVVIAAMSIRPRSTAKGLEFRRV